MQTAPSSSSLSLNVAPLRAFWHSRSPRERQALGLGAILVGLAVAWVWAIAPAWGVWVSAPDKTARLQADLATVQALAAQAKVRATAPAMPIAERTQTLESLTRSVLGDGAQITQQDGRTQVTLQAVPGAALAQWLAAVRDSAQLQPNLARLRQHATPAGDTGSPAGPVSADPPRWDGELVFTLRP